LPLRRFGVLPGVPLDDRASIDPFLFVGREGYYSDDEGIDKTTTSPNLPYSVQARFYNPLWGRWLNPDPIGFEALPNRYAYVQNNPANAIDPSGLIGHIAGGAIVGCARRKRGHH
jgi:RHS repeat-associated protein